MNAVRVYHGIIWHEPPKTNLDTELVQVIKSNARLGLYASDGAVAWLYIVTSMTANNAWLRIRDK